MATLHWRGSTLLGPVPPAMVTVKDPAKKSGGNIITVAWTGIINTHPPKAYISVRPQRYSYRLLCDTRECIIHLTTRPLVQAADFCGMHTGAKMDKFMRCGLTPVPAETVDVPRIAQCPLALECRITDIHPLGSHDMMLCDIVTVDVDEALLDKKGKLHLERAGICGFLHGTYYALGERVASFGDSVRKPNRTKKQTQSFCHIDKKISDKNKKKPS